MAVINRTFSIVAMTATSLLVGISPLVATKVKHLELLSLQQLRQDPALATFNLAQSEVRIGSR
jgi:hypothetical protein